jgi:hypothetical protein
MKNSQKTTLTLSEIYALDAELNGLSNTQTGEILLKGLLNQPLNIKTKYWLTRLKDVVASEKQSIDTLRNELIKKHGEEAKDGNFTIPVFLDEEKQERNPGFEAFNKELEELLTTSKEIEHAIFSIEMFESLETEENYSVFFKLISLEEAIAEA